MKISYCLDGLSLLELNSMLKNLRLGDEHLKKLLGDEKYQALHKSMAEDELKDGWFQPTKLEHIGGISQVLNTIISSTFGSWLALAGAMGFGSLSLTALVFAVAIAFTLSLLGAISSYKVLQMAIIEKLKKYRVFALEYRLLCEINKKLCDNILELAKELKDIPSRCQYSFDYDPSSVGSVSSWSKEMELSLERDHIQLKNQPDFMSLLKKSKSIKKNSTSEIGSEWIKDEYLNIGKDLLSVTIGGFASTFVYSTGIPDIAKQLDYYQLHQQLTTPTARVCELLLAILLTAFFIFTHLYSSRKNYYRDKNSEKTEDSVTKEEAIMLESEATISLLQKMKALCLENPQ